jgi:hypothetical protein
MNYAREKLNAEAGRKREKQEHKKSPACKALI